MILLMPIFHFHGVLLLRGCFVSHSHKAYITYLMQFKGHVLCSKEGERTATLADQLQLQLHVEKCMTTKQYGAKNKQGANVSFLYLVN